MKGIAKARVEFRADGATIYQLNRLMYANSEMNKSEVIAMCIEVAFDKMKYEEKSDGDTETESVMIGDNR